MYVETVPNRGSPPAILLRESYRDGKRIRKRTLLNLSHWPAAYVEGLRRVLKGGVVIPAGQEAFTVERSLPHGHVAAMLGVAGAIGLERWLGPKNGGEPNRPRDLVMAMIVSRVIAPASKLATAKAAMAKPPAAQAMVKATTTAKMSSKSPAAPSVVPKRLPETAAPPRQGPETGGVATAAAGAAGGGATAKAAGGTTLGAEARTKALRASGGLN